MGAAVTFSHADIDPSSIQLPQAQAQAPQAAQTFGHDDIDPSTITPPQKSWLDAETPLGSAREHIQAALNTLPTAGMIAGGATAGALGFAAPLPGGAAIGAAAGSGLGDAAGEALKNLGEKYILGQDKTRPEIYGGPAEGLASGAGAELGGQSLGKVLDAAAQTAPAQWIGQKAGASAGWLASKLSGIPENELSIYASDPALINQIAKNAGYDDQEMADTFRQNATADIQTTKQNLNNQISQTLAKRSGQTIDAQPIVDSLNAAKAQINSKLRPEEVAQVDGLIGKVNAVSDNGQIPLQDAHDLKEFLQEQAKNSFSQNGQIFQLGTKAQAAAKAASGVTRAAVDVAAPEVAAANQQLSKLHGIDDVMGPNLLTEGKTPAPVFTAGSGNNPANAKALAGIGDITGTDLLGQAQRLSTARTFGNPAIVPLDSTGKTVARMGAAALLGGGAGYASGGWDGALIGGALAEGLTSPAALKLAINSGVGAKALGGAFMDQAPSLAGKAIQSLIPLAKGPSAWAQNGYQNLLQHAQGPDRDQLQSMKDQLLNDPTSQRLLMSAGDLKPGSQAMSNLLNQVKAKMGGSK